MRKYLSIIIAIIIFTALSVVEATAQEIHFNAEESELVLRDSENAHLVAKASLDAIGCMLQALKEEVDWTAQECAERLARDLQGLSQEHRLLHPRIKALIAEKLATARS